MPTLASVPAKVGRYPIVRLLGRGAMGSVYLARDEGLGRNVALKMVRSGGLTARDQDTFLERFRNEARAVGRLKHPSIVAVYDVGNDEAEGPYTVFEYVEGATLKELQEAKGPLSPRELVTLAEQIGDALAYAHGEGIIHRDIKPENVMIDALGRARLLDFGVARLPDAALTGEGQFLGTPCYAAPEVLRGGVATSESDQFSLAALLYELIVGARAFPGDEAVGVAHRVIHDEPVPPSVRRAGAAQVPAALDPVFARALAKDPAQRFGGVRELVSALRRAYAESGLIENVAAADTVPFAVSAAPPAPRGSAAGAKQPLLFWPFAVALCFGALVMYRFAEPVPAQTVESTTGDGAEIERVERPTHSVARSEPVAPPTVTEPVAVAPPSPSDAGAVSPPLEPSLSAFEREERAKDALDRAERALAAGDMQAAAAALDEAARFDPENPDIGVLRGKLPR